MKKLKYIALLSLLTLMTSCEVNQVKPPVFATEGDIVSLLDFNERLNKAYTSSDISKSPLLTDRIMKAKYATSSSSLTKRDGKEINNLQHVRVMKSESKYDYSSLVGKQTVSIDESEENKSQEESSSTKSKTNYDSYIQFGIAINKEVLIQANAKSKEYMSIYVPENLNEEQDLIFDNHVKEIISGAINTFENYRPISGSGYHSVFYYINDKVFTYSYTQETSSFSSSEGTMYKQNKTTNKVKAQIDLNKTKQFIKISVEANEESTYFANHDGRIKGDVISSTIKEYFEYSVEAKEVSLKEIDISDFAYVG